MKRNAHYPQDLVECTMDYYGLIHMVDAIKLLDQRTHKLSFIPLFLYRIFKRVN